MIKSSPNIRSLEDIKLPSKISRIASPSKKSLTSRSPSPKLNDSASPMYLFIFLK